MPVEIIVEDGSGKDDANSFVSLEEATAIADLEPDGAAFVAAIDDDKIRLLSAAFGHLSTRYEEMISGDRLFRTQTGLFPRVRCRLINGDWVPIDEIPSDVKKAQVLLAVKYKNEYPPYGDVNPAAVVITDIKTDGGGGIMQDRACDTDYADLRAAAVAPSSFVSNVMDRYAAQVRVW
jgi:hypothetical protein